MKYRAGTVAGLSRFCSEKKTIDSAEVFQGFYLLETCIPGGVRETFILSDPEFDGNVTTRSQEMRSIVEKPLNDFSADFAPVESYRWISMNFPAQLGLFSIGNVRQIGGDQVKLTIDGFK